MSVIEVRSRGSLELALEQAPVLGDAAVHSFAPKAKTGGLQLAAHDRDDIPLDKACALFNFLETCSVLPSQPHNTGDLLRQKRGLHGAI